MRLQDKIAIVTGAGRGIGGACATLLARHGAAVILTDIEEASGNRLASAIGGVFVRHDIADEQQWADIVNNVISTHGRVDVLVNVAAIAGDIWTDGGPTTSLQEWRRVMRVNLDGTFIGCRTVWPHMVRSGRGSIINMSSGSSFAATPMAVAYGASKAGIEQLTRSFAMAGASEGKRIRCNSVHPGFIKTQMTDEHIAAFGRASGFTFEEAESKVTQAIPFGARGTPEDVAQMVVYLASDESAYVTGAAFRVDGGSTMILT